MIELSKKTPVVLPKKKGGKVRDVAPAQKGLIRRKKRVVVR